MNETVLLEERLEKISQIDWLQYSGSGFATPQQVIQALTDLLTVSDKAATDRVYEQLMHAVAHDQSGAYFPVMLDALPFILFAALQPHNPVASNIALCFLWDIYYCFWGALEGYTGCSERELDEFVVGTIAAHAADFAGLEHKLGPELADLILKEDKWQYYHQL